MYESQGGTLLNDLRRVIDGLLSSTPCSGHLWPLSVSQEMPLLLFC